MHAIDRSMASLVATFVVLSIGLGSLLGCNAAATSRTIDEEQVGTARVSAEEDLRAPSSTKPITEHEEQSTSTGSSDESASWAVSPISTVVNALGSVVAGQLVTVELQATANEFHPHAAVTSVATISGNLGVIFPPQLEFVDAFPVGESYLNEAGWPEVLWPNVALPKSGNSEPFSVMLKLQATEPLMLSYMTPFFVDATTDSTWTGDLAWTSIGDGSGLGEFEADGFITSTFTTEVQDRWVR